jgi:hypothetical protein
MKSKEYRFIQILFSRLEVTLSFRHLFLRLDLLFLSCFEGRIVLGLEGKQSIVTRAACKKKMTDLFCSQDVQRLASPLNLVCVG